MSAATWQDRDDAGAEATAELRGETLVWQMLLHQARANLANLSAYPHDQLRRKALDAAADHLHAAETLLRALDDVLDPKQSDVGHSLSTRHLADLINRSQQAIEVAR
jgi:hypothetical protein